MLRPRAAVLVPLILGWHLSTALSSADTFDAQVKPFLKANCITCHAGSNAAGGLSLDRFLSVDAPTALKSRDEWELISRKLISGEMPPKGMPRPSGDSIDAVRGWVDTEYARIDRTAEPNPGRVTARRLNRYEYNQTVFDLLGVDYRPADDFPADDSGYGFDNIGDILTVSPALMQKYLKAAQTIAEAIAPGKQTPVRSTVERYLAERIGQYPRMREEFTHTFPADGEYHLRSTWYQKLPNGLRIEGSFFVDGKPGASVEVTCTEEMDRAYTATVLVPRGPHRVMSELKILDPAYSRAMPYLEYTEVQGPAVQKSAGVSDTYRKVFLCGHEAGQHQASCPRRILTPLAERAWRRPVSGQEVASLLALAADARKRGDSFEQSIGVAVQAVLVSPYFLFRIEKDHAANGPYRLDQHELATRMSYFLWSSMPDDELRSLADRGQLRGAAVEAQVRRMLADAKSKRLVEAFFGQWLQTRNLDTQKPDSKKFPEYNEDLRDAMRTETALFLHAIVSEDRSVLDLIDGRFTFLNDRLARYYGVAGVTGDRFRLVELDGTQRSGVLTQASVLTVSSYPTRTSPVIRGKYLLENFLGAPPPPPPPNVPPLEQSAAVSAMTVRQELEKHRSNAVCASCHSKMDPLGFGLENYDAIGRWRTADAKLPVDSSGVLPDGRSFSTPAELKDILKSRPDVFVSCIVRKMLVFALGRGLENYDARVVEPITAKVAAGGYRFSKLAEEVVKSDPFQMRTAAKR